MLFEISSARATSLASCKTQKCRSHLAEDFQNSIQAGTALLGLGLGLALPQDCLNFEMNVKTVANFKSVG